MAGSVGRRWLRVRRLTALALVIALAATAAVSWATYSIVHDQEQRLLKERVAEVNLVLTSAIGSLSTSLATDGAILQAKHGSKTAFEQAVQPEIAASPQQPPTFAWLKKASSGNGYVVLAAAGNALHDGQVITDVRAQTFDQALQQSKMVATPVFGAQRNLGFALGPPAAPAGTVLYRQAALGPVRPPQSASTAPFHELNVAVYTGPRQDPQQVLTATTRGLPLRGDVRSGPLMAGITKWTTFATAKQPLVGSIANDAWWFALIAGILGSLLIAAIIDSVLRRRDTALALYATEHEVAETLQRSLLPRLPDVDGVELAARYFAGGAGQQVGGDWFDAFPVGNGALGVTVGDVIGHDLAAASAMAQIRAALRAFAIEGAEPSLVINRLDHLVDVLALTQLVTVVYAVLDAPAEDGSRRLRLTNAGHLAPLMRHASGRVETIDGADSVVIGAPIDVVHGQVERTMPAGATLLFFTDGLVEVPSRSLDEVLDELVATVSRYGDETTLDELCDRVIEKAAERELRDDIAVLAVRSASAPARSTPDSPALDRDYVP